MPDTPPAGEHSREQQSEARMTGPGVSASGADSRHFYHLSEEAPAPREPTHGAHGGNCPQEGTAANAVANRGELPCSPFTHAYPLTQLNSNQQLATTVPESQAGNPRRNQPGPADGLSVTPAEVTWGMRATLPDSLTTVSHPVDKTSLGCYNTVGQSEYQGQGVLPTSAHPTTGSTLELTAVAARYPASDNLTQEEADNKPAITHCVNGGEEDARATAGPSNGCNRDHWNHVQVEPSGTVGETTHHGINTDVGAAVLPTKESPCRASVTETIVSRPAGVTSNLPGEEDPSDCWGHDPQSDGEGERGLRKASCPQSGLNMGSVSRASSDSHRCDQNVDDSIIIATHSVEKAQLRGWSDDQYPTGLSTTRGSPSTQETMGGGAGASNPIPSEQDLQPEKLPQTETPSVHVRLLQSVKLLPGQCKSVLVETSDYRQGPLLIENDPSIESELGITVDDAVFTTRDATTKLVVTNLSGLTVKVGKGAKLGRATAVTIVDSSDTPEEVLVGLEREGKESRGPSEEVSQEWRHLPVVQ